ncbi:hypothetical protein KTR66_04090 [Roseococcus sp. SDR]|uniref:MORN repeat-containing protein n=1 Tax=Roseococcus sp. SDR TaxID=2835532 RepID=UPI001BD16928|nr:hypothetical protein [Roseococcus sp. SDR]MBS7789159.1 hypothetical protein [Roseococcus sp. SDR]MBV1844473.1 hypothetical protein [Roseococcus sp. SDR]
MRWSLALLAMCCAAGLASAQNRPAPPLRENLAEPFRPGWVVDPRNGCWLWNSNPQPNETVTWSGACPRGPAQGQGRGEWRSQDGGAPAMVSQFSGQMREGRLDGQATVTWPSGNRYEGAWMDGRQNGHGVYLWANGARYDGEWRDGRRQGHGVMLYPNGDRYEGRWRDGRFHGEGVYVWANGNRYEGEYRDDRADGQGAYFIAAEQRWYRGAWFSGCHLGPAGARASIARPLSDCP